MSQVTVFLRTALFSFGTADAHVPHGTLVLRGTVVEQGNGLLTIAVTSCLDERARELAAVTVTLDLPLSKVDHLLREA